MDEKNRSVRNELMLGWLAAIVVPLVATAIGWIASRAGYSLTANVTPSMPIGLYLANANERTAERGRLVAFRPHNDAAQLAYERGWMKTRSRYAKQIAAVAGDMVCADESLTTLTLSADGSPNFVKHGPIALHDREGRPLPRVLDGCRRVPHGHFLPLGINHLNSFDGRYYGFVPVSSIEARLVPLWTHGNAGD